MDDAVPTYEEFEELRVSLHSVKKNLDEETKRNAEATRKKDVQIRDINKEIDSLQAGQKSLKKANEETKRSLREHIATSVFGKIWGTTDLSLYGALSTLLW